MQMTEETNSIYPGLVNEKTILGIFMGNAQLFNNTILDIHSFFFRVPVYRCIYEAMLDLQKDNLPIDEYTLQQYLRNIDKATNWKKIIDEMQLLAELYPKLNYYINQLRDDYTNECLRMVSILASDTSISTAIRTQECIELLLDLKTIEPKKQEQHIGKLMKEFVQRGAMLDKELMIETGFASLDEVLNGSLEQKQFVVVGARTGMGKQAFLAGICNNMIAKKNKKILFISFNSNPRDFIHLMVSSKTGIPSHTVNDLQIKPEQNEAINNLLEAEQEGYLHYHFQRDNNVHQTIATINSVKRKHEVDVVIIDTLQQLEEFNTRQNTTRNNSLGKSLKRLKKVAEDLNVLIFAGSELSRNADIHGRPLLSDMKDSGWIEELADKVFFIYRPEYYNLYHWEDGSSTIGMAEIIVAKNNIGKTGTIKMLYDRDSFCFRNFNEYEYYANELAIPDTRKDEY